VRGKRGCEGWVRIRRGGCTDHGILCKRRNDIKRKLRTTCGSTTPHDLGPHCSVTPSALEEPMLQRAAEPWPAVGVGTLQTPAVTHTASQVPPPSCSPPRRTVPCVLTGHDHRQGQDAAMKSRYRRAGCHGHLPRVGPRWRARCGFLPDKLCGGAGIFSAKFPRRTTLAPRPLSEEQRRSR